MPLDVRDRPTEGSQNAHDTVREPGALGQRNDPHLHIPVSARALERSLEDAFIYNYSQPFSKRITSVELGLGAAALAVWFAIFMAGIFVSTAQMRAAVADPSVSLFVKLGYISIIGVSYTLTNVLFLTCLAAFVGCMWRRWQVGDGCETIPSEAVSADATRIYVAAVLRGFFLYLMFISGFLAVSTEKTVVETEFAQYIRIAGITSIIGFIVGYDPNLIIRLMHRILSLANLPLDHPTDPPAGRRRTSGDSPSVVEDGRPRNPR